MTNKIRFGAFVREATIRQNIISLNELVKHSEEEKRIKLRSIDIYRLAGPYISIRFVEQMRAVIPLALYLMLFQIFILRQSVADAGLITAGLVAVILGLMLFMEGLKVGLMPFGETLGNTLPVHSPLPVVLVIWPASASSDAISAASPA